jgi:small-conductance mechanosensitive channel
MLGTGSVLEATLRRSRGDPRMIIQTDEKSVTLTPFGSLALNGVANVSRDGGQSWIEMIRRALSLADRSRSEQPPRR